MSSSQAEARISIKTEENSRWLGKWGCSAKGPFAKTSLSGQTRSPGHPSSRCRGPDQQEVIKFMVKRLLLLCFLTLFLCMCIGSDEFMCYACAVPVEVGRGSRTPRTGVIGGWQPRGCWDRNPGSPQEKQMLSRWAVSPAPQEVFQMRSAVDLGGEANVVGGQPRN